MNNPKRHGIVLYTSVQYCHFDSMKQIRNILREASWGFIVIRPNRLGNASERFPSLE